MSLSTNVSPSYSPPYHTPILTLDQPTNKGYQWFRDSAHANRLFNRNGMCMAAWSDGTVSGNVNSTANPVGHRSAKFYEIFTIMTLALANFTDTVSERATRHNMFNKRSKTQKISVVIQSDVTKFFICYNHRSKVYAMAVKNRKRFPPNCVWTEIQLRKKDYNYKLYRHSKQINKQPLYLMLTTQGWARVTLKNHSYGAQFLPIKVPAPEVRALRDFIEQATVPPSVAPTTSTPTRRYRNCKYRKNPKQCRMRRRFLWRYRNEGKRKRYCRRHRKRYRRRRRGNKRNFYRWYNRLCLMSPRSSPSSRPPRSHRKSFRSPLRK